MIEPLKFQWETAKELWQEFISHSEEEKQRIIEIAQENPTPFLLIREKKIEERFQRIKKAFEGFEIFYAVKANDYEGVIEIFNKLSSGFEVASINELKKVLKYGVEPYKIISSNPIKPLDFIDFCLSHDVDRFAVDSWTEIDKLSLFRKRARIYVRLAVPNLGSDWPLSGKFGVDVDQAVAILEYAKEKGLIPYGITFHVGSQCNNLQNWFFAIKKANEVWFRALQKGIKLKMLNLGGGIPVRYLRHTLTPEEIAHYVRGLLNKYFHLKADEYQIEPGRGLIAPAGVLITQVIGKAKRENEEWIYLDTGVFHGLAEVLGGIRYSFYTPKEGNLKFYTLGGISCDGMDVIARKVALPENIEIGDYVFILPAGAYTTVYASEFNGFPKPYTLIYKF